MNRIFGSLFALVLAVLTTSSAMAQTNLLTAGDFEGSVPTSSYWAPAPGIWGGEHYTIAAGTTNGVTPFGSQMLEILHSGGGSAAQVHQMVEGPFVAGSEVTFEVSLNSHLSGVQAGLILESRSAVNAITARTANTYFLLDNDPATWETFTVTQTLSADTNFLAGEIVLWHGSLPIPWFTPGGYADNAVLTVVPPVVDTDGDGVPDDADACPASNLNVTVTVLGSDSGVENIVFANGCSTADLTSQVIADCLEGGVRNHGQFASCTARGLNTLLQSGVITDEEKDALQSAAAESDVGKKQKPATHSKKGK